MKKQEKEVKQAKKPINTTKSEEAAKTAKAAKKPAPAILRPFIRFGAYIAASFRELRLMRFPNRASAWKMTIAIIVYALIFFIFIALLDAFWSTVFQRILG
jgi:preprotein translocase SecE subunit